MTESKREVLKCAIRKALVDEVIIYELSATRRPDILVAGCRAIGYCDPEDAAEQTAYIVADAVLALTHPDAQGNKDLGEPQTSFAWQKIETAPKDGTRILLGCPASRGFPGVVEKAYWWAPGKKWWDWFCPDKPTHWAPLPQAPSERSEAAPTPQPIKGESRFTDACKAADAILAPMTAKFGRILEEAPTQPVTVSICGYRVEIPAKKFMDLYAATDRTESELESASNGMGLR